MLCLCYLSTWHQHQVGSFECVDVCASYEQQSSVVVDDNAVAGMISKAQAEEDESVVGEDCIFGFLHSLCQV
jgi:hypothetical protein